jgi:hypothetical protein
MKRFKCDNCGQYKVVRLSSFLIIVFFLVFSISIPLSFLLIGIPMMIISLLVLAGLVVVRITGKGDKFYCQNCQKQFTIKEALALSKK